MPDREEKVVLGNEAIARGIVESGCHFFASYPGTPSSEILPAVVRFKKENNLDMNYISKRLAAKNLSMKEGETLKEMAARYNTTPIELMKMILVENPSVK